MMLSYGERKALYARQAEFTRGIRFHAYRMMGLANLTRILEVGSGAGAIAQEIGKRCPGIVVAVDRELGLLKLSGEAPNVHPMACDAVHLPFADSSFEAALGHFIFMWVTNPGAMIAEMKRVVKRGGWLAALAEPDYGGWIDYPSELEVGKALSRALRAEGADPDIGRKLKALFSEAGLDARIGLSPSIWDGEKLRSEFESEWEWRFRILGKSQSIEKMKGRESESIEKGERVLFMPIFWAIARNS